MTLLAGDHRNVIAQLSGDLHLPLNQVGAIYYLQFDRLAKSAHIRRYLGLLAAKRTRAILRASQPAHRVEG
jgi:hypothetical protein